MRTDSFGDFKVTELAAAVDDNSVTERCIEELVQYGRTSKRTRWLVFAVNIEHAEHIAAELHGHGVTAATVSARTPAKQRAETVAAYRSGRIGCLVSVACLSTGFDVPAIDLIGMLRPTRSPALYAQMLGRGSRPRAPPAAPAGDTASKVQFTDHDPARYMQTVPRILTHISDPASSDRRPRRRLRPGHRPRPDRRLPR